MPFFRRRSRRATCAASLRFGDGETRFEDVEASLAGGRLSGQLSLRGGADGLALRGRLALTAADAAALFASDARSSIVGRVALQADLAGKRAQPSEPHRFACAAPARSRWRASRSPGLDPKAFDTVIRAVDQGATIDAAKIRDTVASALDIGRLAIPRADGAFTVAAGQARWGNVVVRADGADLTVTASLDLADGLLDARLTLSRPQQTAAERRGPRFSSASRVRSPRRSAPSMFRPSPDG